MLAIVKHSKPNMRYPRKKGDERKNQKGEKQELGT
jgi:hypothetical protein